MVERPLKNKFVHRATAGVMVPPAAATQKIPMVEKPRNFMQATCEEAEAVLADTEIVEQAQLN